MDWFISNIIHLIFYAMACWGIYKFCYACWFEDNYYKIIYPILITFVMIEYPIPENTPLSISLYLSNLFTG